MDTYLVDGVLIGQANAFLPLELQVEAVTQELPDFLIQEWINVLTTLNDPAADLVAADLQDILDNDTPIDPEAPPDFVVFFDNSGRLAQETDLGNLDINTDYYFFDFELYEAPVAAPIQADNLRQLPGVNPQREKELNKLGINTFVDFNNKITPEIWKQIGGKSNQYDKAIEKCKEFLEK